MAKELVVGHLHIKRLGIPFLIKLDILLRQESDNLVRSLGGKNVLVGRISRSILDLALLGVIECLPQAIHSLLKSQRLYRQMVTYWTYLKPDLFSNLVVTKKGQGINDRSK